MDYAIPYKYTPAITQHASGTFTISVTYTGFPEEIFNGGLHVDIYS